MSYYPITSASDLKARFSAEHDEYVKSFKDVLWASMEGDEFKEASDEISKLDKDWALRPLDHEATLQDERNFDQYINGFDAVTRKMDQGYSGKKKRTVPVASKEQVADTWLKYKQASARVQGLYGDLVSVYQGDKTRPSTLQWDFEPTKVFPPHKGSLSRCQGRTHTQTIREYSNIQVALASLLKPIQEMERTEGATKKTSLIEWVKETSLTQDAWTREYAVAKTSGDSCANIDFEPWVHDDLVGRISEMKNRARTIAAAREATGTEDDKVNAKYLIVSVDRLEHSFDTYVESFRQDLADAKKKMPTHRKGTYLMEGPLR